MIKRFNPDFSLSISHELAYMRETPEGGYVAHGDYATLFSELELVKAERDALLAENVARGEIIERLIGIFGASGYHAVQNSIDPCSALMYDAMQALKGSGTSAALAAIEARGVDKFAVWASDQESMASDSGDKKEARIYCQVEARAKHFANKLREAKDGQ